MNVATLWCVVLCVITGMALADGPPAPAPVPTPAPASTPAPAAPSRRPAAWLWFEGPWEVTYKDAVLGDVTGVIQIGGTQPYDERIAGPADSGERHAVLLLMHPTKQRAYRTDGVARVSDGKLVVSVDNRGPASGDRDEDAGDAQVLPIRVGTSLQIDLDGATRPGYVVDDGPPGALTITMDAPAEGAAEQLAGRWRYSARLSAEMVRSRAGEFDEQARTVTGEERWRRPTPRVFDVGVVKQMHPAQMQACRRIEAERGYEAGKLGVDKSLTPLADLRGRFGDDVFGSLWVTLTGPALPVQPGRAVRIAMDDPGVAATGKYRLNPADPRAMDVELALRSGFDDSPKPLSINSSRSPWSPEPAPPRPAAIQFIRRANPFETVQQLRDGDVFYVEVTFAWSPVADRQTIGVRIDEGEVRPVELHRTDESSMVYRSRRVVLLASDEAEPAADDVARADDSTLEAEPPLTVRAKPKSTFAAGPIVIGEDGGQTLGISTSSVTVTDQPYEDLWAFAMRRVEVCRAKDQSEKEFKVRILTNAFSGRDPITRTIPITPESHAAAILLRRELVTAMDEWIARENQPAPIDLTAEPTEIRHQQDVWQASLRAESERLIELASSGGSHPLFSMTITIPGDDRGDRWYLGGYLHKWPFDRFRMKRDGEWEPFIEQAQRAIAEARGKLIEYSAESRRAAAGYSDCEVRELLKTTGAGLEPMMDRLVPRLMRRARPGEPVFPRWVPDTKARAHVRSSMVLAAAVAAQEEYSTLDKDVAMTIATGAMSGATGTARLAFRVAASFRSVGVTARTYQFMQATAKAAKLANYAVNGMDIYSVALHSLDYQAAIKETQFAQGLIGVADSERYFEALENEREQKLGLIQTVVMASAFTSASFIGGKNLEKALAHEPFTARQVEPKAVMRDMLNRQVLRSGIDSLPSGARSVFDDLAADVRVRLAKKGPESISPGDRLMLMLADNPRLRFDPFAETVHAPRAAAESDDLFVLDPSSRDEDVALHEQLRRSESATPDSAQPAPGPQPQPPANPARKPKPVTYTAAERKLVDDYLRGTLQLADGLSENRIAAWEKAGLDARAAIAGLHYVTHRSRLNLPMTEAKFRAALDRFFQISHGMPPARRAKLIDAYLDGSLKYAGDPRPASPGPFDESDPFGPVARPDTETIHDPIPNTPRPGPHVLGPQSTHVQGFPGPGVRQSDIDIAKVVADRTGVTVVLHGDRQTPPAHLIDNADLANEGLSLSVIGGTPEYLKVAQSLMREPAPPFTIKDIRRFSDMAEALSQGHLVVRPDPNARRPVADAGPPPVAPAAPPPPPFAPPLPAGVATAPPPLARPRPGPQYCTPIQPGQIVHFEGVPYRLGDAPINTAGAGVDLYRLIGPDGQLNRRVAVKVLGTRIDTDTGFPVTRTDARHNAGEMLHGQQRLDEHNASPIGRDHHIPNARILHDDALGDPPMLFVEFLDNATRPHGVDAIYIGRDAALLTTNGRIRGEVQDAIIELWHKMIAGGLIAEDLHMNNLYFYMTRKNGSEVFTAGILDPDRLGTWADLNGEPAAWVLQHFNSELGVDPVGIRVRSLKPLSWRRMQTPRAFMLKMLEHRQFINFDRTSGTWRSGELDIRRVQDAFPDLDDLRTFGRTSMLIEPRFDPWGVDDAPMSLAA